MSDVKPIPDGYHTITPHLVALNAADAIEFYKKAFGAEELFRMPGPDGKGVMHAELRIGSSNLMIAEECEQKGSKSPKALGGTPVSIHLYVEDCDKVFAKAVEAGATATMPTADMFWGDRFGMVQDPFGHNWSIATHKKDLTPEEIAKGAEEFAKSQADCSEK